MGQKRQTIRLMVSLEKVSASSLGVLPHMFRLPADDSCAHGRKTGARCQQGLYSFVSFRIDFVSGATRLYPKGSCGEPSEGETQFRPRRRLDATIDAERR